VINYTEVFTAINRTLREVFPTVVPYSVHMQSFGETWGFNAASLGPNPAHLTPAEVDARLAERGIAPLDFYDGVIHSALFALPPYIRAAIESEDRIITAENPLFVF
ncbi:MAG: spermidine synthase, partial [Chloroflexota bacterium]|nr:spermidine synthase [Chloroflexota bacterium]